MRGQVSRPRPIRRHGVDRVVADHAVYPSHRNSAVVFSVKSEDHQSPKAHTVTRSACSYCNEVVVHIAEVHIPFYQRQLVNFVIGQVECPS